MKKAHKKTKTKKPVIELSPEYKAVDHELAALACIAKKMRPFTANGIVNALNTTEAIEGYLDLMHVLLDRFGRQAGNVNTALIRLQTYLLEQEKIS